LLEAQHRKKNNISNKYAIKRIDTGHTNKKNISSMRIRNIYIYKNLLIETRKKRSMQVTKEGGIDLRKDKPSSSMNCASQQVLNQSCCSY
jgi:hypothetical protein